VLWGVYCHGLINLLVSNCLVISGNNGGVGWKQREVAFVTTLREDETSCVDVCFD
jgi:hypothetical protein